nr:hypothetical protein [uncultured Holophaga sp.]
MSNPPRTVPQTPLDTLRVILSGFSEGDTGFQPRLNQLVQRLQKQALPSLGGRLAQAGSPKGLKRAIYALVQRYDWPDWTPWLIKGLLQENDLGVFDEGCAALGSLAIRDAHQGLEKLLAARSDPNRKVILQRELAQYTPQQPLPYYLGRLQEGQGNPRLALQGARILAATGEEDAIRGLIGAYQGGDAVTRRLALRILASFGASDFILGTLQEGLAEFLDLQQVLQLLRGFRGIPRNTVRATLFERLGELFSPRAQSAVRTLQQAEAVDEELLLPAIDTLKALENGWLEHFVLEAASHLALGKVARYSAFESETVEAAESRREELNPSLDQCAELLAFLVDRGDLPLDQALPPLHRLFQEQAGSQAAAYAYLRLLPPEATERLDEVLAEADIERRMACLDALGTREEDGLTPFFLRAAQDPIIEVGQKAIHHLGKLPSSLPRLLEMFHSSQVEQIRKAIRVFGENRPLAAAEPLLEFIQKESRDSLVLEAVEALSGIIYQPAAPVYLQLLHDGQPLNLQIALAEALGRLHTPEASLGLLAKAPILKAAPVLILCLEGALKAFPSFTEPLPMEQLEALMQLLDRCCDEREGEGNRLRAMVAMEGLHVFSQGTYERLKDRFADFLSEMRLKEVWDKDNNDRIAALIKELSRRGESLRTLAQHEQGILTRLQQIPPKGPQRAEALLALREALNSPELILRTELGTRIAAWTRDELDNPVNEWREIAHICEIGGLTRQQELVEVIRPIFQRATGLGLKSATRKALLDLGLSEEDLLRHAPIHSLLVLEPSSFFRKRLVQALGAFEVRECGNRQEAEAALRSQPVDLLLTESADAEGELSSWIEAQWDQRRIQYALLSTATRDAGPLADSPWVLGALFKPYPLDQLLKILES